MPSKVGKDNLHQSLTIRRPSAIDYVATSRYAPLGRLEALHSGFAGANHPPAGEGKGRDVGQAQGARQWPAREVWSQYRHVSL